MPKERTRHYQTPDEKSYSFFDPDVSECDEINMKRNMKRKARKYNRTSHKGFQDKR